LAVARTGSGAMDIGTFAMVFALTGLIALNVWNLTNRLLDFFDQSGTLAEAIALVTAPHEITDAPNAGPLVVRAGTIRFENVTYAHPDGSVLFDGLDLHIAAGERVALVG